MARLEHPEEPFVRLTTDGIWTLNSTIDKRSFSDKQLLGEQVAGGFKGEVPTLLKNNDFLNQKLSQLVNEHFPETIHEDILVEVGLDLVKPNLCVKPHPSCLI